MAPGGMLKKKQRTEKNNFQSPMFSSTTRPNHDSPIEKGIRGLHTRSKSQSKPIEAEISTSSHDEISEESGMHISNALVGRSGEINQVQSNETTLEQPTETTQHPSTPAGTNSKKRVRGLTMGKSIMKTFEASGSKMKISVDPLLGRPKDANESAKLASQIGVVTRDVLCVPKRWKEVDKSKDLNVGFDHLNIHMDVNIDEPGVKDCLADRLQASLRQKRHLLHKHYKKFATVEEAKRNKPSYCCDQKNWEELCDHYSSEKFKDASIRNALNRSKVRAPHVSGRKPFTVRRNEISQKEFNGDPCDRIELYKRTHHSEKKGWSSSKAEENWNLMKEKQLQYNEDGNTKTLDEIVEEVLGRASGYVKGLGYGPKPSKRISSYDVARQQQQEKELFETQQKLKDSQAQVVELTDHVTNLEDKISAQEDKLSEQGANIEKLMAFMRASGN
ncbi:hypothetical protein M5689_006598 [Euphorbia peplus]|nr:hypothetical protein M5689_000573 [Euphorbia peplus]WCJ24656.1 hypothetical protein M5689_006598 [Euphorbia peplus]